MTLYESYDAVTAALKVAEQKLGQIQRHGTVRMFLDGNGDFSTALYLFPSGTLGLISDESHMFDVYEQEGIPIRRIEEWSAYNKVLALENITKFRDHVIKSNVEATQYNRELAAKTIELMEKW